MEFSTLTLTVVILIVGLYLYLYATGSTLTRTVYLSMKIPGPSLWKMVTVHAKGLLGDNAAEYTWKMCANYGHKPWGMWTHLGYIVMVSDCDAVSQVYKNKHLTNRADMFREQLMEYVGKGMLTLNGEEHRVHRKIFGPAFRKNILEHQLPGINDEAAKLVQRIREKGEDCVDVRCLVEDQVAAIMAFTFTSGVVPYENDLRLFHVLHDVATFAHLRSVNPLYYWLVHTMKASTRESEAAIRAAIESVRDYVICIRNNFVTHCSEELQKSPFHVFVEAFELVGEESCTEEVLSILGAGQDTTAFVVNIALILLAFYPVVQDKVFQEIQSTIGRVDRPASAEDLAKMVYLEMFLKETLRVFPAVPVVARTADEETRIGGVVIPKGGIVVTQLMAINRDPKFFRDPLRFDPERFSPESSQGRHPFAYVPFGGGNRVCPGQLLAIMILKTVLCHVVRNFQILPGDGLKSIDDLLVLMHFTLRLPKSSLRFVCRDNPTLI